MLIDKCQTKLISKSREYIADFQGGKGGPIGTIKILVLKVYRQFVLKLTYIPILKGLCTAITSFEDYLVSRFTPLLILLTQYF